MFTLISSRSTIRAARAVAPTTTRLTGTRFSSTMHDNDPATLEKEKHRNLQGKQDKNSTPHEHAPGWNEPLASASEASVKADQATGSPDDLQKRTVESRHSSGDEDDASTRKREGGKKE
ncbi:hypothetical protein MVEN_00261800 [Mycena venus]|uniref:Uncharacterized protein n=1 Tax=Mycena venus TaxID=2733690 RepID=A0A8H6Z4W8_9AGAR|nr:hypothetical protein MVEN_00261800 [Mycena venus]